MTRSIRLGIARAMVVAGLGAGLAGCLDYTLETTLEPDGTGVRVERMEIVRNDDFSLTEAELRALTLATGDRGWTASTRIEDEADTTWVLERRIPVRRLSDWSHPSRRVLVLGATPARADEQVGYVRLGDVVFRSSVQVAVTRRSDGTSLVTYRESFLWDQAADALVEFLLADLDRTLRLRYPRLEPVERGAVIGFARARMWVAGDEGLFFGENEDEAIALAAERTADQAVKIVRLRYPEARPDELRQILTDLLEASGDQFARLFEETLPGLNLGFNTTIRVRLTMPGTVTTTNAAQRDGNTLEWSFSPLDDLRGPVEVFAEAVVGG